MHCISLVHVRLNFCIRTCSNSLVLSYRRLAVVLQEVYMLISFMTDGKIWKHGICTEYPLNVCINL